MGDERGVVKLHAPQLTCLIWFGVVSFFVAPSSVHYLKLVGVPMAVLLALNLVM